MCLQQCRQNEDAICCDTCNIWSHRKCNGINNARYKVISEDTVSSWHCPICEILKLEKCGVYKWPEILKILEKLHKDGYLHNAVCRKLLDSFEPIKSASPKLSKVSHKTDLNAERVLQEFQMSLLRPLCATGNGNCLYNTISILLVGDETRNVELRARTFLELKSNVEFYTSDKIKKDLFTASGQTYSESLGNCSNYSYSSAWHIQAS